MEEEEEEEEEGGGGGYEEEEKKEEDEEEEEEEDEKMKKKKKKMKKPSLSPSSFDLAAASYILSDGEKPQKTESTATKCQVLQFVMANKTQAKSKEDEHLCTESHCHLVKATRSITLCHPHPAPHHPPALLPTCGDVSRSVLQWASEVKVGHGNMRQWAWEVKVGRGNMRLWNVGGGGEGGRVKAGHGNMRQWNVGG